MGFGLRSDGCRRRLRQGGRHRSLAVRRCVDPARHPVGRDNVTTIMVAERINKKLAMRESAALSAPKQEFPQCFGKCGSRMSRWLSIEPVFTVTRRRVYSAPRSHSSRPSGLPSLSPAWSPMAAFGSHQWQASTGPSQRPLPQFRLAEDHGAGRPSPRRADLKASRSFITMSPCSPGQVHRTQAIDPQIP
jgi:hypothetical protein